MLVSTECPRRSRGIAATPSQRNVRVTAAAAPRLVSTDYPRRSRGCVAAMRPRHIRAAQVRVAARLGDLAPKHLAAAAEKVVVGDLAERDAPIHVRRIVISRLVEVLDLLARVLPDDVDRVLVPFKAEAAVELVPASTSFGETRPTDTLSARPPDVKVTPSPVLLPNITSIAGLNVPASKQSTMLQVMRSPSSTCALSNRSR